MVEESASQADEPDVDIKRLRRHCIQLAEHYDTIQIIVTRHETDTDRTLKGSYGHGNWYANFGAVAEWVEEKREQLRQNIRDTSE